MSTLKDFKNVNDSDSWKNVNDNDSWEKLRKEVEAMTDNQSQQLSKLTEIVLEGFIKRMVKEPTRKKKMIIVKKDIKCCPVNRTHSLFPEQNEDYLNRKQKKQKTENDSKEYKQKIGNDNKKQSQKKGIVELKALGLEPPPYMPEAFKNCIQNLSGTEIKLVIQKFIQVTDLKKSQNRLSMPVKQVKNAFLTETEEKIVENIKDIEVVFIEPCLKVSNMHLTKWHIGGSKAYVFKTKWHDMATRNSDSLKPMSVVQVWSFRVQPESKLGFALIKVGDGEDGHVI